LVGAAGAGVAFLSFAAAFLAFNFSAPALRFAAAFWATVSFATGAVGAVSAAYTGSANAIDARTAIAIFFMVESPLEFLIVHDIVNGYWQCYAL
jgi:hypothetical protein